MTVESVAGVASVVSTSSIVVATKDQIGCDLGAEEVILNLESGIYYGLNEVGASIWKLVQEPKSVADILDAIMDEYDVQRDRCENDILQLLNDLAKRNLIGVIDKTN